MLSETQRRLLLRLAEFGAEVENAWDVPRTLSLPGLAEHLGVVRSAIHTPLKELETSGLVRTRSAHVIGGGSRRRSVIHLTPEGRERAEALAAEGSPPESIGRALGPMPDPIHLHGRDAVVDSLVGQLLSGSNLQLSGLPGIGKTSLARAVAGALLERGLRVRWATCDSDTDAAAIGSQWLDGVGPRDPSAIASAATGHKTVIILDEVQELHDRHLEGVTSLLTACTEYSTGVLVSVRAPSPFGTLGGFEEVRIDGLDNDAAVELLADGVDADIAEQVAEALGGHPLALHLWSPEEDVPGEGQEVQEFVQSTVLRRLSEAGLASLDELSLAPVPLSVAELSQGDGTVELDESAVLRWMDQLVEPHHLIRNVRRATIDTDVAQDIHSRGAELWSQRDGTRARRMEAHHRLNSGEKLDSEWLADSVAAISREDSAAAAVLIEEAVEASGENSLRLAAIDLAFERGESPIASQHLELTEDSPQKRMREARLARLCGDTAAADSFEQEALADLSPSEAVRAGIASLVRSHDDRLPGQPTRLDPAAIDTVDITRLPESARASASLALDLLRHAVAIESGSVEIAANVRSSLVAQMGEEHPRLALIDLRARISANAEGALDAAREFIESSEDDIERIRAIHAALEATSPNPPEWLTRSHGTVATSPLRADIASHRRIVAQRWYWRGVLEPTMRLSHWREAISRFKSAECPAAAAELLLRLTRSL